MPANIVVEVAYALPEKQYLQSVKLEEGATVEQAIVANFADWQGRADAVLVDAPCSGSGTWRRNPEARWRLDEAELARTCAIQQHVLTLAAALVRPGGRVLYAVCSLLDEEGAGQVDAFLAAHPGWRVERQGAPAGRSRGRGGRRPGRCP